VHSARRADAARTHVRHGDLACTRVATDRNSLALGPSPSSPVVAVSSCAVRVGPRKFPLHFDFVYFGRESKVQFLQEDRLLVRRTGDTTFANFRTARRREHHVHQPKLAQFRQHPTRFAAQPGLTTLAGQGLAQHVRHETHQNVSQHPVFGLMPDRSSRSETPPQPPSTGCTPSTAPHRSNRAVRPQQVAPGTQRRPVAKLLPLRPTQPRPPV